MSRLSNTVWPISRPVGSPGVIVQANGVGASGVVLSQQACGWLARWLGLPNAVVVPMLLDTLARRVSSLYQGLTLPSEVSVNCDAPGLKYLTIFRPSNRFAVSKALGKFPRLETLFPVYVFALQMGMADWVHVRLEPHSDGDLLYTSPGGWYDNAEVFFKRLVQQPLAVMGANVLEPSRQEIVLDTGSIGSGALDTHDIASKPFDASLDVCHIDQLASERLDDFVTAADVVVFGSDQLKTQCLQDVRFPEVVRGKMRSKSVTVADVLAGNVMAYRVLMFPGAMHAGLILLALDRMSSAICHWCVSSCGLTRGVPVQLIEPRDRYARLCGDWYVPLANDHDVRGSVSVLDIGGRHLLEGDPIPTQLPPTPGVGGRRSLGRNSDLVPPSSERDGEGYCYLAMLRLIRKSRLSLQFGPDPVLAELIGHTSQSDWDCDALSTMTVVRTLSGLHCGYDLAGMPAKAFVWAYREWMVGRLRKDSLEYSALMALIGGDASLTVGGLGDDDPGPNLSQFLVKKTGCPHFASGDIDLVSRSVAFHSDVDKNRFRMLAAVGDAFLTYQLSLRASAAKWSAQRYQQFRSSFTSTAALAGLMEKHFDERWFVVPAGVLKFQGKVGADFFEVVLGMLVVRGAGFACKFLDDIGVFDDVT